MALGLLLAGPALAQEGPLTTLMRPQPLDRAAPLGRAGELYGESPLTNVPSLLSGRPLSPQRSAVRDPARPGESVAPCEPLAGTRRPGAAGYASGGSGPGEYQQFVNGGHGPEAAKPPAPVRRGSGDRPLSGDSERPLWGDPAAAERAPRPTSSQAPRQSSGQASGQSSGQAIGGAPLPAEPAPGVDRPLWADGSAAAPGEAACDATAQRAGVPSQTLYFGVAPTR